MMRPGVLEAVGDRRLVVVPPVPLLAHAREQEDLVVHREPEQHREQEDRDPRLDLRRLLRARSARPSRAGRRARARRRSAPTDSRFMSTALSGSTTRAERAQQDQVGDDQHREHEPRERAVGLVDEVDAERRRAGHAARRRRREARPRDVAVADAVDEVDRLLRAGVGAAGDADLDHLPARRRPGWPARATARPDEHAAAAIVLGIDLRVARAAAATNRRSAASTAGSRRRRPAGACRSRSGAAPARPARAWSRARASPCVASVVSGMPRLSPPVRLRPQRRHGEREHEPAGGAEEQHRPAHDRGAPAGARSRCVPRRAALEDRAAG